MEFTAGTLVAFEKAAQQKQHEADMLTATRQWGGLVTSARMASRGESWVTTAGVILLELTDKLDGDLAREAAKLRGDGKTTPEGSEKDHIADKVFYYSHMAALAINDYRRGRKLSAAFVTANIATVGVRDWQMAQFRKANQHKDTKARLLNKFKTQEQDATIAFGVSPLSRSEKGLTIRNAAILAGTALSWISYIKFKKDVNKS